MLCDLILHFVDLLVSIHIYLLELVFHLVLNSLQRFFLLQGKEPFAALEDLFLLVVGSHEPKGRAHLVQTLLQLVQFFPLLVKGVFLVVVHFLEEATLGVDPLEDHHQLSAHFPRLGVESQLLVVLVLINENLKRLLTFTQESLLSLRHEIELQDFFPRVYVNCEHFLPNGVSLLSHD